MALNYSTPFSPPSAFNASALPARANGLTPISSTKQPGNDANVPNATGRIQSVISMPNSRSSVLNLSATGFRSSPTTPGPATLKATQILNASTTLNEADNIKVAVRVRPLFPAEADKGALPVLQVTEDHAFIKVVVPGPAGNKMQRDFAFHACLGPDVSQSDVLHLCGIPQLLDAALAGYNVTIFAYGQTGSGKTYTMSGYEEVIGSDDYQGDTKNDGIMTRAVNYLYSQIKSRKDAKYALSASYLEIYNEGIFDLLNLKAKNLPVKWDAGQGFFVPGLKSVACTDVAAMMDVIRTGMKHRHVGSHMLNIESSRSHSIMTIQCCATPTDPNAYNYGTPRFGKICFVDLAGSERLKDSKSEGTMLKETTNINKSLFVLGKLSDAMQRLTQQHHATQVISALADRDTTGTSAHIPYRDSKLTKLLMDSLGGSALALMIACCSPSSLHVEETLSTLSYATRAKNIQNRPTIQYDPKEQQISALRREIELLRQENTYLREQIQNGSGSGFMSISMTPATAGPAALDPNATLASSSFSNGAFRTGFTEWPSLGGEGYSLPNTPHTQPGSSTRAMSPKVHIADAVADAPYGSMHPSIGTTLSNRSSYNFTQIAGLQSSSNTASTPPNVMFESAKQLEPLKLSAEATAELYQSASRQDSHAGASSSAGISDSELVKRLKETQGLLLRFSEENGRLAKENDRLRINRQVLSAEHADVLDEIEQLRSKLCGLETAVISGAQTPSTVKALLSTIKATSSPSRAGTYSPTQSAPSSPSVIADASQSRQRSFTSSTALSMVPDNPTLLQPNPHQNPSLLPSPSIHHHASQSTTESDASHTLPLWPYEAGMHTTSAETQYGHAHLENQGNSNDESDDSAQGYYEGSKQHAGFHVHGPIDLKLQPAAGSYNVDPSSGQQGSHVAASSSRNGTPGPILRRYEDLNHSTSNTALLQHQQQQRNQQQNQQQQQQQHRPSSGTSVSSRQDANRRAHQQAASSMSPADASVSSTAKPTKSNNSGSSASSGGRKNEGGGIIIADQSKLSLLLGN